MPPDSAARQKCWMCQRTTALTKAGTFRKHKRIDPTRWRQVDCDGSGTFPVVERPAHA